MKRKVLVYLFGSLGDSIVTIPALRAVRRHFREAEIVLLQNFDSGGLVLASQVIPADLVDRCLNYRSRPGRLRRLTEFFRLRRELRRERFDSVAYLVPSERPEKAVLRDRLFFRSSGIKDLYGFHAIAPQELYPLEPSGRAARSKHEAVFKLERLTRDGIEWLPESDLRSPLIEPAASDLDEIDEWLKQKRQKPEAPLISIGPGCKQQVNEWPLENFARLGSGLTAEGFEIIAVGGDAEQEMAERLMSAWGGGLNATGLFSVRQSAALLSRCSFHIGLDTGTTHLAAAVGTRCFVIFGERNSPGAWYPLGGGHTIIHHPVPCAPCRSFTCAVPGHPCMTGITFESVWKHLAEFIAGEKNRRDDVRVISV